MGDYISVIQRRRVLIAAMTLAGLVLALFYSVVLATPSFVSHAEVEVKPIAFDIFGGLNLDREINMGTERELARSDSVGVLAEEKLDTKKSVTELQNKVTVSAVGSTQVLSIDCAGSTRVGSQECAKAFSESYIEHAEARPPPSATTPRQHRGRPHPHQHRHRPGPAAPGGGAAGQPQEAEADAVLRGLEDQASPYRDKLAQFNTLDISNPAFVVSPANRPSAASSPKPKTNALMGAFFGFFLGLLVAFARDRIDGRLRGRARPRGAPAGPGAGHRAPHPPQRSWRSHPGHDAAPAQPGLRGLPVAADPDAWSWPSATG